MKMSVSDWKVIQRETEGADIMSDLGLFRFLIEIRTLDRDPEDALAIPVPKALVPAVLKIMSDNDLKQHLTEWVTDEDGVKRKVVKKVVPRVP